MTIKVTRAGGFQPKSIFATKKTIFFVCPTGDEGSSSFGFMGQTSQAKMLSLLYTVWCDLRKRIVTNAHPLQFVALFLLFASTTECQCALNLYGFQSQVLLYKISFFAWFLLHHTVRCLHFLSKNLPLEKSVLKVNLIFEPILT